MIKFITITNRDITTTAACTSGISLFEIASKTVLPNPGHAKITSTTTTPLITKPNSKPIIVDTSIDIHDIDDYKKTEIWLKSNLTKFDQ